METHISLKDFFGGEATGFTPWLQKHPKIIQDLLEEEYACCYKREQKVENFYIDLLFRKGNELYVVENQYGESDHDHLGKCITYTSLVNAKKTIWIAEKFLDEHIKVLNSLKMELLICTACLEKTIGNKIKLKIYKYSKNSPMKQYIYTLDNDKNIINSIKA